ncbi:MAG: serine/threonine-protein kinase [bacterium]
MIGKQVGPYEIVEKLGAGGMGEVYRARDPRLGRDVAVKFISPGASEDKDRLRRFLVEARTVSGLNHPNIVTLHEIGESDSGPYLVTEFVEGRTVRRMLTAGTILPADALDVAIQAARGLQKAHDAGIVHRDIKPENLMMTPDGFVKVLDFGLAKLASTSDATAMGSLDQGLTAPGIIVGTPAYAAPEQLQGQPVDARTDVFALGVVLYEMLAGANPFRRESAIGTLNAILNEVPPPLDTKARGIPDGLAEIVAKATAKSPDARYASAREFESALAIVRAQLTTGEWAAAAPKKRSASFGRIGGGVAVAAGALLLFFLFRGLFQPGGHAGRPGPAGESAGTPSIPIPPSPAIALPEGDIGVAVLPVEDRTGDPMLRDAKIGHVLADALVQVLSDLRGIYAISPYRIEAIARSLGRSADDTETDPGLARQVAATAGAGALLSGTLSKIGESYVLDARLVEIPSERVLETMQARATKPDDLLDEVTGRVAEQLRRKYAAGAGSETGGTAVPASASTADGEKEGGGVPAASRVATRSLDAYAHYIRGSDLVSEGDWENAVGELQKAVDADPGMALAWSQLACAFSFSGDDTRARAAHLKAAEHKDRLNEMEKRWVDLDGLWVEGGGGKAYLDGLAKYMKDFPDDRDSYFYAGLAEEYLNGDCAKALDWYEKAFAIVPAYYPVTKATVDCLLNLGRKEDAIHALERFVGLPYAAATSKQKATWRLQEIRRRS